VADSIAGEDPRYTYEMSPAQLEKHWQQMQKNFGECPTCNRIVCLSDYDTQSGTCQEDSPRAGQIAEARASQAGAALKGFASAFGLGGAFDQARQAAEEAQRRAAATTARCPSDGTLAPAGTKFCPNCGTPMVQPASTACPKCGSETGGARFCPNCGNKMEQAAPPVAPAVCPNCGAETKGARFCAGCGTKLT
jgi:membrane protease subunit (stomatin/prohibitin family)